MLIINTHLLWASPPRSSVTPVIFSPPPVRGRKAASPSRCRRGAEAALRLQSQRKCHEEEELGGLPSAGLKGTALSESGRGSAMAPDPWQLFPSMFHAHSHSCSPNESSCCRGAVHPGSSLVAWPECQTPPSRETLAQRTQ